MGRLLLAVLAGVVSVGALTLTLQPAGDDPVAVEVSLPERKAPAPPAATAPPAVPAALDALSPVSFDLETEWQGARGARTTRQHVIRARDRVRLLLDEGRQEWLFERNPTHPDRVTGYLINHDTREIVVHHESDLRNTLRLRGWADVAMMRFDPQWLDALRDTGERRDQGRTVAHRYRAEATLTTGLVEAWWSPDLLLPLEQTSREAGPVIIRARILNLSDAVDGRLLAAPTVRFPDYQQVDAVDAGEDHS